jgi:CDP-diacylglycerol--serine O-phosphatidyltransferase
MSSYRGIFPGTFTMGNVVCGFLSILSAYEGNVITACWLLILAVLLDMLDGKVARISGGASQFGVELDSLADFLSFGAAPALVVYASHLNSLGRWGWIISVVYIMAAAYRLARFNLMAETEEKKDFLGLPVPAAALALVSYIIMSHHLWGELRYEQVLVSMIILFAALMVSQVQYDTLPEKLDTPSARVKVGVAALAAVVLLFAPRLLLFPIVALYILFGMLREFVRVFHKGVGRVTNRSERERPDNRDDTDG